MYRATLAHAKAARIWKATGICPNDENFLDLLNEAQQRLLSRGRWWGTIYKATGTAIKGAIVWPREAGAIEGLIVVNSSIWVKNQWWNFIEPIFGGCSDCCAGNCGDHLELRDDGYSPFSIEFTGTPFLRLYPTDTSDNAKEVLIQGYDKNGAWVRNEYDDVWIDGEYVALATPFGVSTTEWKTITAVQKPVTNERVLAKTWNGTTETLIATWAHNETVPRYRKSLIPALEDHDSEALSAIIKMQFVPAAVDEDWLVIGNIPALKDMMMSIRKQEQELTKESIILEKKAIAELNHELRTNSGDVTHVAVKIDAGENMRVFGGFR